jgi:hypothetical protein
MRTAKWIWPKSKVEELIKFLLYFLNNPFNHLIRFSRFDWCGNVSPTQASVISDDGSFGQEIWSVEVSE